MMSVTQRIKSIKQPYGGYLPARSLHIGVFDDGWVLGEENVHPSVVGTAVDTLSRATREENSLEEAFDISLKGARLGGFTNSASDLIDVIRTSGDVLSGHSIRAGLALVKYDSIYRAGFVPPVNPVEEYQLGVVSATTLANVRTMVQRTTDFFDRQGGVTVDGFHFIDVENLHKKESVAFSGYSNIVSKGDGDALTPNGLWDIKVSVREPNSNHTLQLVMYYLMGLRSRDAYGNPLYGGAFHNVEKLGIFNPRLNIAYTANVSELDRDMLKDVEIKVIGYPESEF